MVVLTKLISLSGALAGFTLVPMLTARFHQLAAERPATMTLLLLTNVFLIVLSCTPLLLHFLTKRYVIAVHYNASTKVGSFKHGL
jgi:hypothetical protein